MPFLAPVVAAVGAFIANPIVQLALSAALSLGVGLLSKKPKIAEPTTPTGVETELRVGGRVAREIAFGRVATAGHLVFWMTSGSTNSKLSLVFALADGRCHGLADHVFVDGVQRTLTPVSTVGNEHARYSVDGLSGTMIVRWFDGREGQTVDSVLSALAGSDWASTETMAGMAYVTVDIDFDADLYSNVPSLLWVMDGYRCYDPRKDSTAGGTGTHRWSDPDTWEFSESPALQVYNYLRGPQAGGEVFIGPEVPAVDLLTGLFVTAANACDESVSLDAGGTEARYRASAILRADGSSHREKLAPLVEAMAGYMVERSGYLGVLAGVAQTVAATITDDDLALGEPVNWSRVLPRDERVNEVHGQFIDPAANWQPNDYPPYLNAAAASEDGERLAEGFDLSAVTSRTQAERAARIRALETRYGASARITLDPRFLYLEPGDWITWESERWGGTRTYRVMTRQLDGLDRPTISLRETASAIYAWSTTDEGTYTTPPTPPAGPSLPTTVANFAVQATTVVGAASEVPAYRLTWDAPGDPRVDAVIIEYRIDGDTRSRRLRDDSPEDGEYLVTDFIQPGTDYEFRATIETTPARPTTWTAWTSVQSSSTFSITIEADLGSLTAEFQDLLQSLADMRSDALATIESGKALTDAVVAKAMLEEHIRRVSDRTEMVAIEGRATAAIAAEKVVRADADVALASSITALSAEVDDNAAAIVTEATARADGDEATAALVTALEANLGNLIAGGYLRFSVAATPSGVTARVAVEVNAGDPETPDWQFAGLYLDALSGGGSRALLVADQVLIGNDTSAIVPFVIEGGVVKMNATHVKDITAGRIRDAGGKFELNLLTPGAPFESWYY